MAITQKNIINEIPTIIRSSDFLHVTSLRTLVAWGWGYNCALYAKVDCIVKGVIDLEYNDRLRLNKDDLSLTKVKCKKCNDNGYTVKKIKDRWVRSGCIACGIDFTEVMPND